MARPECLAGGDPAVRRHTIRLNGKTRLTGRGELAGMVNETRQSRIRLRDRGI
ncbi:hypothetical protein G3T14_06795 [Methylobacterium sp. BTF04]|uniref:hypothetical protein n=1 Tax=Methylobacterium sp. BTF04 TaxID=2708300 RepID=UPI0013D056FC|nr:hypothetical protein [Methylobacterium sp. BTF04]NEU11837.1 hypothetical protein [Methylobacterium sp. BTF04]